MKTILAVLFVIIVCTLTSCALTESQQQQAIAGLRAMLEARILTQEQFDALVAALTGSGWSDVLNGVIGGALTLLGIKSPQLAGILSTVLARWIKPAPADQPKP